MTGFSAASAGLSLTSTGFPATTTGFLVTLTWSSGAATEFQAGVVLLLADATQKWEASSSKVLLRTLQVDSIVELRRLWGHGGCGPREDVESRRMWTMSKRSLADHPYLCSAVLQGTQL